jgi:hypothetical protein
MAVSLFFLDCDHFCSLIGHVMSRTALLASSRVGDHASFSINLPGLPDDLACRATVEDRRVLA